MDPATFTARELMWMAGGRMKAAWSVASWKQAFELNASPYRKKGTKPVQPDDINPLSKKKARPQGVRVGVGDLVGIFKAVIAAKKP